MHVLAISLLDFIQVSRLHEGQLIGLGSHLFDKEFILYLPSQRNQPKHPVAAKNLLDILDLSTIV